MGASIERGEGSEAVLAAINYLPIQLYRPFEANKPKMPSILSLLAISRKLSRLAFGA
jgi:hypothetical protein